MALICRTCGSDLVDAGVGNHGRCMSCGRFVDLETGQESVPATIETVVP